MENHDLDLVTVLETSDTFALALAKSSLEDAGIDYVVSGDDPRYIAGFPGAFAVGEIPLWKCSSKIQVARESEAEARALLFKIRLRRRTVMRNRGRIRNWAPTLSEWGRQFLSCGIHK